MTSNRCIGFGDLERKCQNFIDKPRSKFWCQSCEDERRNHITKQMKNLAKSFKEPPHDPI